MPADQVTQCPHCKATFKVSDEQLAVANGKVRCGACMNIFDALAYAVSNTSGADSAEAPLREETFLTQTGESVSNSAPAELENDLDEGLIQDNPDEDKTETSYSENALSAELSTSFLELDKEELVHDPYATEIQKIEPHIDDSVHDESWAESMLEEDESPSPAASESIEADPFANQPAPDPITAVPEDKATEAFASEAPEPDCDAFDTDKKETYESFEFKYNQDASPKKRHWIIKSFLIIFNTCLVVVLAAQIAWFNFEKFAAYPQVVYVFEKACSILECKLPELADLSKIKSHNLVVRSHPTRAKALIIDTVIINEAGFQQRFPDIALYFSDINGKTVAQRLIHPNEYLSQELLTWKKMPSQESIHISLEIMDPGREAVNYSLKFFPQSDEAEEQTGGQMSTNQNKI